MPNVSKFEAILEGLKKGAYPTLGVSIGSHTVTPGGKIPKADTQSAPTLSITADVPPGSYTIFCLDLDAPFTSFNLMSPIAHWIQADLKKLPEQQELASDSPVLGAWVGAGPPPGAAPHRYVFLLYSQKPDSTIQSKPFSMTQRIRFDLDAAVQKLDLGELVAVNYFVSN